MNRSEYEEAIKSFNFRAHYAYELMTEAKEKSYRKQYDEAVEARSNAEIKLSQCSENAVKKANGLVDKIDQLNEEIARLEPIKDISRLSETCMNRLIQIYTEITTGRTKDIKNKYLTKGIMNEELAIDRYSLHVGKMFRKNKDRIYSDHWQGEIDLDDEERDMTIDTKCSWDVFSFDKFTGKELSQNYYWQGQVYMMLKKRSYHRVVFCLENTPEKLLENEIKKLKYDFIGSEEDWDEALNELKFKHNYDDLPDSRRIKIFEIDASEEAQNKLIKRAVECKAWLLNYKQ